ncbi:MAG: transporter, partial [Bacilli bacterium]|nr:transporter [Bacilli bacterium]
SADLWAGMIFGANHLFISIFSPLWGRYSDRFGQKRAMIYSGIGSGIVIGSMAFAGSPIHLLLMRCLFGVFGGFGASAVSLIAISAPKEKAGEALGKLQTGNVVGGLIGPLLGGMLAESIGMEHSFLITGGAILFSTFLVMAFIKDTKKGSAEIKAYHPVSFREVVQNAPTLLALYFTSFLISAGIQTIEPVITLYVKSMGVHSHAETVSGLVFAMSAFGMALSAGRLGELGDRIGAHKVLLVCLAGSALLYIPQSFVNNPYLFGFIRFLIGICMGGIVPSISALLRRSTERAHQGIVFGFNQTASSMGNVIGPLLGGLIDRNFGMQSIFFGTSFLFLVNFLWVFWGNRRSKVAVAPVAAYTTDEGL